jgi:hypothetical protein
MNNRKQKVWWWGCFDPTQISTRNFLRLHSNKKERRSKVMCKASKVSRIIDNLRQADRELLIVGVLKLRYHLFQCGHDRRVSWRQVNIRVHAHTVCIERGQFISLDVPQPQSLRIHNFHHSTILLRPRLQALRILRPYPCSRSSHLLCFPCPPLSLKWYLPYRPSHSSSGPDVSDRYADWDQEALCAFVYIATSSLTP